LEVVDYVLPEEGLREISVILRATQSIFKFFTQSRQLSYPTLYDIIREQHFDDVLIQSIDRVIDEKGQIRADASPELMAIRRRIHSKQQELEKQFRSIINQFRKNGWLADTVESFRNGRRVLTVPSEHKRKIKGIIHDESTTGKTAFIEPEAIIEINNDIFDLETGEKREIYRILKELSALLRPYVPLMRIYQGLIVRFDVVQAKARLAHKLKANMPKIVDRPHLGIIKGFHPLLLLKNEQINRKTVPFTLTLFGPNRILVLSGPNAGGKSITMKSVGLLQMMFQAGMLIPVDPESEFGIFDKLFADIGDSQSLEDDLSTYSSRLRNMRLFLEGADAQTLVLIDEFGSGTDPKIGGAIAEAILKELNQTKVFGVITTHYSNLKMFAYKNKGIVNGSMTFSKDNLAPTYELKVGRPGSSYAFEIAQKSGLHKKVLNYAKHKAGKNEKAIDELLIDLQREKRELEDQLSRAGERERKLEKLIKNYENLHRDLEYKRKKLKLEEKERSLQTSMGNNKAFERLIREIREEKNLEKAKALAAKVKQERKTLSENVNNLREEIYYQPSATPDRAIEVGDFVKLKTGGATGKVESIQKGKAVVLMGIMKMTTKIQDLQHANEPLDIRKTKSVQANMLQNNAKFESKLDLRGLRRDEALKILETFVDKALVSSATHLRIIHGKGDGILRKAVWHKLKEYDAISSMAHPEDENGGDGVTLVELD
ncbi:MAG: Smr/MutS family protein, partial [Bacteroidota bacterium]